MSRFYYIITLFGLINFQESVASEEENFFIPNIAEDRSIAEELEGVDLSTEIGREYFDAFICPRVMQEFEEAGRELLEEQTQSSFQVLLQNLFEGIPPAFFSDEPPAHVVQFLQSFLPRSPQHLFYVPEDVNPVLLETPLPFTQEEDRMLKSLLALSKSHFAPYDEDYWLCIKHAMNFSFSKKYINYIYRNILELQNRVLFLLFS